MGVLLVSGTGSQVGKTLTASALAACARGHVTVVKLAQVGLPAALVEVTRLAGVRDVHEAARYPDAVAPHHAAREAGLPELRLADTVRQLVDLDAAHDGDDDLVLVIGTGGLLVPYAAADRWTLADLAVALHAPVLLATVPGRDTANHLALAVGRLAEDGVACAGVVVTRWPAEPSPVDALLLDDVAALAPDAAVAGLLPTGLEQSDRFADRARAGLAARWGGTLDPSTVHGTSRATGR